MFSLVPIQASIFLSVAISAILCDIISINVVVSATVPTSIASAHSWSIESTPSTYPSTPSPETSTNVPLAEDIPTTVAPFSTSTQPQISATLPCSGLFLGTVGQETQRFRRVCKDKCEFASNVACEERPPFPSPPLRSSCLPGSRLGFFCSISCCFWSPCYNMYQPVPREPRPSLFWRRFAISKRC